MQVETGIVAVLFIQIKSLREPLQGLLFST